MNGTDRRGRATAFSRAGALIFALAALAASPATMAEEEDGAGGGRGFAGLGGEAQGFAAVGPGRALDFPADYGQHPDYRIEWWYITANLYDDAGERFGVQWTLFRQALAPHDDQAKLTTKFGDKSSSPSVWRDRQIWMAHIAATSADAHYFEERLARGGAGQAGVRTAPFEAWLDNWSMVSPTAEGFDRLTLSADGAEFSYRLELQADGAIVPQGDGGYHVKSHRGPGAPQASYYYSQPHYRVSGSLTLEGTTRRVQGQGWLDREWSSRPLAPEQVGWDWFSLHFQSGEKMMAYQLRRSDGASPDVGGTWVSADGVATTLKGDALRLTPLDAALNGAAPRRWRIEAPQKRFAVDVEPLNGASWQGGVFPYWEGPVAFSGTHRGVGFLEMTGYAR